MKQRGFTLIELMIVVAIIGIAVSAFGGCVFNTPGQTEARATSHMETWIGKNLKEPIKRKSCAHDSDGDGLASCTIVTEADEKIFLQCPSDAIKSAFGADSCKETEGTMVIQQRRR